MSWTSKAILALVELMIHAGLTPVAVFTLYKHRGPSVIGHIFFFIFIILRMVSDGLTISHRDDLAGSDTTGSIINSIGVSPLLLATTGFIEEARSHILDYKQNKQAKQSGLVTEVALHTIVIAAVALLAAGNSKAATATGTSEVNKYRHQADIGAVLLLLAWALICAWGAWTFRSSTRRKKEGRYHILARLLLTEITVSLLFTGVRVCYSMVYTFDRSPNLNPATSSFAVAFSLIFLVQLISASIIVLGLVVTRNIQTAYSQQVHVPRYDGRASAEGDKIRSHN